MKSGLIQNIGDLIVTGEASVLDALAIIDTREEKIALVTAGDRYLLGVVTDGDIRRHLLKGGAVSAPVHEVMNSKPVVAKSNWDHHSALVLMRTRSLRQVPVTDDEGRIVGIYVGPERLTTPRIDTPVLVMAGGRGVRLRPFTDTVPKPMLEIGGDPMLEIIVERLVLQGFHRFYMSLHYLPQVITSHFGDGSPWGCSIEYLIEEAPLGTGGALGLLPAGLEGDVLVTNGDVVTNLDYSEMLSFHRQHRADLTVCTRTHEMEVPFGVITQSDMQVKQIVEKPVHRTLINTGVYVVGEEARARVEPGRWLQMTDLISRLIGDARPVASFTTNAEWADVGRPDDLHQVRQRAEEAARLSWIHPIDGEAGLAKTKEASPTQARSPARDGGARTGLQ